MGAPRYYMGSADWMNRNLHSRVEIVFPVYEANLTKELEDILQMQLSDNTKAVYVTKELDNPRIKNRKAKLCAQQSIYDYVKNLK
jgi:polyphosphate kinase